MQSLCYEVYEKIIGIAGQGSICLADILAINRTNLGYIFDSASIRFKITKSEPQDVNEGKKKINDQTTFFLKKSNDV